MDWSMIQIQKIQYNNYCLSVCLSVCISMQRAISVNGEFEDGHFFLGRYYDKLMCALGRDQPAKYG